MMHVIGRCDYWWRRETINYWPTPYCGGESGNTHNMASRTCWITAASRYNGAP